MSEQKVKLAIFDADGTLKEEFPMGLLLLDELNKQGLFTNETLTLLANLDEQYAKGELDRNEMSERWITAYLKEVNGKDPKEFARVAAEVWEKVVKKHFDFVSEALEKLRAEGFEVIVISASPHEIVYEFCKTIGVDQDHFRGTRVKVGDEGLFVAEPEVLLSLPEHKVLRLKEMIKELFAGKEIDWENSIGMGDSGSDKAFMKLVGKPIAVCEKGKEPNGFIAYAQEMGWQIVDEDTALAAIKKVLAEASYHQPEPLPET